MGIGRIGKHLVLHRWRARKLFPRRTLAAIEQAIKAGEATHSGQVRFVVEGALDGAPLFRDQPARERAIDIFSQLRIWDTAHNNGVLIYLLLADRDVEIIADRGIDAKVGRAGWEIPSPKASMFAWAPLPPALKHLGSLEFSKQLLTHAEVAVAPGVGYGEDGEGFVRIAMVENEQRLRQAARNIKRYLQSMGVNSSAA